MRKFWVLGWCATPGVIIPFMVWWMAKIIIEDPTSWESIAMMASAGFAIITFVLFASVTVSRQEQYDCFSVSVYFNTLLTFTRLVSFALYSYQCAQCCFELKVHYFYLFLNTNV